MCLGQVLALCNLPPNTSASLLRAFDENGDAEWSYTEFVQALKRKDHSAYKRASPSPAKVSPDWMPEEEGQSTAAAMPPRASPVVPVRPPHSLASLDGRACPLKGLPNGESNRLVVDRRRSVTTTCSLGRS